MSRYIPPARKEPWGAIYVPDPPKEPKPVPEPSLTPARLRALLAGLDHTILFGAIRRYAEESIYPRDRPEVTIIRNQAGGEFWTGDVTTGGAAAFFALWYGLETALALHAGANELDASVAGWQAATAAYRAGVPPDETQPPVTPGTPQPLRGPISVSGRDFEVPQS